MAKPMYASSFSRPLRIFLVEDHPGTRQCMQMYLQSYGHVVLCVGSIAEALEVLPRAQAEVLLCDLTLPDGDGRELLRRLQVMLPQPIYAIALSGHGCSSDHQTSRETGFRHHLNKPFDPRHLAELLAEAARQLPASVGT